MSPFSRRALVLIVGLSTVSFACAILFAVTVDPAPVRDSQASVHSASAIGHRAFADLLERVGIEVTTSHWSSGMLGSDGALLIVAEPREAGLSNMVDNHDPVLVVLPKRSGVPSAVHRGWIDSASLLPREEVERVLHAAGSQGSIVRPAALRLDQKDYAPAIDEPQLIQDDDVEPIVGGPDGMLLGRREGGIWILSDPDLIANHGLGRADNAPLAVAIVERVRGGRRVMFDETLHGHERIPSFWRELFAFPLVLIPIAVLLAAAVLLWAAGRRWGAPVPVPPAFEPGKATLIAHAAELMERGGHTSEAVARYLQTTLQVVARKTHAPPELSGPSLHQWLEQLAQARGVAVRVAHLEAAVAETARAGRRAAPLAAAAAARIDDWHIAMVREKA